MSICSIASASLTPGFRDRGFERIKIDHHEIDRLDSMFARGRLVLLVPAHIEQAAVHFGMQRLDPAVEHFGKAGEGGNAAHFDSGLAEETGGAAGGNDFDALLFELAREIGHAGFIGNGNESAGNFHEDFRCTRR